MFGIKNPYRPDRQPGSMGDLLEGLERKRLRSFRSISYKNFITERPSREEVRSQRRGSWCDGATEEESKADDSSEEDSLLRSSGATAAAAAAATSAAVSAPIVPDAASLAGRSVRETAALFKGGKKPETPELFRRRQGQEAAAYRAKVEKGRESLSSQDLAEESSMAASQISVQEIAALFGGPKRRMERLGLKQDQDAGTPGRGFDVNQDHVEDTEGDAEHDDPYRDIDAAHDEVGQEPKQSPSVWNLFSCCLGWR